ncbi:MAG: alpha/beta fold hydrolase, partial [Gemmatimonadales bacterium]
MHLEIEANGTTLAVHVEGSGPAVLFIHGYPLDHRIWDPQLNGLEGWRRIAPDLRGFGHSPAPAGVTGLADYAADLGATLDALEVEQAVVVGLSMGGYIAFECLR